MMRTICHANKFVKEASATAVPRCSTIYVSIIMATKTNSVKHLTMKMKRRASCPYHSISPVECPLSQAVFLPLFHGTRFDVCRPADTNLFNKYSAVALFAHVFVWHCTSGDVLYICLSRECFRILLCMMM